MGRRKKCAESEINDMCLACQFYQWQENKNAYVCVTQECRNNSKFQVYRPAWMERKQNEY